MEKFDVVIEKEYYDVSNVKNSIGLVMMLKNEKKRLQYTLESTVGYVDALVIYDTGSTDNTMEIVKKHSEKHKINLYMIQGEFVDFSTSRNVVLRYADTKSVDFLLLLDCNDILRGGDELREFVKTQKGTKYEVYLTCQIWWSGKEDKYYNMRIIKNHKKWKYNGVVHEWIGKELEKGTTRESLSYRLPDTIALYQDRTQDDDKSGKRFTRDRVLLLAEHEKNPEEPRTVFYLAQTCACLKNNEEALKYYSMRSKMKGFWEEIFHSYYNCGNISRVLKRDWGESLTWYMKALEFSERAEPLVKLAEYYQEKKKWGLAYMFTKRACQIPYPKHCILFVDKQIYDYTRWHLMGIVGYYAKEFKDGEEACIKAIKCNINVELNKNNLKFYEKLKPEKKKLSKKEFTKKVIDELKSTNPKMNMKKMVSIANNKWKKTRTN